MVIVFFLFRSHQDPGLLNVDQPATDDTLKGDVATITAGADITGVGRLLDELKRFEATAIVRHPAFDQLTKPRKVANPIDPRRAHTDF